jgi:hypothetical protein
MIIRPQRKGKWGTTAEKEKRMRLSHFTAFNSFTRTPVIIKF